MYTPRDIKNLNEIKAFLEENDIEYDTEYDNFCLHYGNPDGKRMYEIEYIPSHLYPIAYEKYGIEGVEADYFYLKSYKAEHEDNSFKCWVKDYEWEDDRKREVLKSYFMYAAGKIKIYTPCDEGTAGRDIRRYGISGGCSEGLPSFCRARPFRRRHPQEGNERKVQVEAGNAEDCRKVLPELPRKGLQRRDNKRSMETDRIFRRLFILKSPLGVLCRRKFSEPLPEGPLSPRIHGCGDK